MVQLKLYYYLNISQIFWKFYEQKFVFLYRRNVVLLRYVTKKQCNIFINDKKIQSNVCLF